MVELFIPHRILEQHLERQALAVYRPASFLGISNVFSVAPATPALLPNGARALVRASDIYAARSKWLVAQDLGQEQCCLSLRAAALTVAFQEWLTTGYTPRYRSLTADTQRAWLSQVTLLVVVRYLMEEKHARFLMDGRPTFADPWVGHVIERLYTDHHLANLFVPVVKQMRTEPEEHWSPIIARFLKELDIHMSQYPFVQPEPLPPLPPGVTLPYVLPTQLTREEHTYGRTRTGRALPKGGA